MFRVLVEAPVIDAAIRRVADEINRDLKGKRPLFVVILNGAFMFAADLLKLVTVEGTEVSFVKVASYAGLSSSGRVETLVGLKEDIAGRTVVIVEDMVDSGQSMVHLTEMLGGKQPERIYVATMFCKPKALAVKLDIDYCALELENDFVVGRGLDYDGWGRNYPDLYVLDEN